MIIMIGEFYGHFDKIEGSVAAFLLIFNRTDTFHASVHKCIIFDYYFLVIGVIFWKELLSSKLYNVLIE